MFTAFLVKYAEIFVKGKNRYLFEEALVSQIKNRLKACDGTFLTKSTPGRIYVLAQSEFDYLEVTGALCKVFGVTAVCPVVELSDEGFEELCKCAASYVSQEYPNPDTTFKVVARRSRKNYPLTSTQINEKLGEALLVACPNLRVDVHHPDFYLYVEIRERIYIYSREIPGLGGMPLGTGGKAMLLLSGGIDSPVAGYMIAKRGVTIDAVYFHAPPYTSERAKQKVIDLTKIVSGYAGTIYLHVINFSAIQMLIYDKCPHEELTILMRRYMMRIAQRIAKDTQCQGLITGESIGQVASQTLASMAATDQVCEMPCYRPLVAFDKQEIIEIAQKIGTYETSILPYEDCCTIFVAKHPVTKPSIKHIERHETYLGEEIDTLLENAIESREVLVVNQYTS